MIQFLCFLAALSNGQLTVGQYAAPGPNDQRSPCPMFNTMANHGYLPRDGGEMTKNQILEAFKEQGSFDPGLTSSLIDRAFQKGVGNPAAETLNMTSLRVHGLSEHDASLFRNDYYFGQDWYTRNSTLVQQLISYSSDGINISGADLARFRRARYDYSKSNNPTFQYGLMQEITVYTELGLLAYFLNPTDPSKIPIKYLKAFVDEERLPIAEGWKKKDGLIKSADVFLYGANLNDTFRAIFGVVITLLVIGILMCVGWPFYQRYRKHKFLNKIEPLE